MRRILVGLLLTATSLGTAGVAVPAAHAAGADVIHGGCKFESDQQGTVSPDTYYGVIWDASITTTGDTTPMPIGATVTCSIEVNGVTAASTTHTYGGIGGVPGVQAGADPISFTADDTELVAECQTVNYADGTTTSACTPSISLSWPPCGQTTEDCLVAIMNALYYDFIDPVVCPYLVAHAGSYPGGVTIEPDGDVYVPDPFQMDLNPLYDCPPYFDYPPYN